MSQLTPAPRLFGLRAYAPPKPAYPTDLRLDANEGAAPPAELLATIAERELWRRYPNAAALEELLAARFAVPRENVLATAGADDALYRACLVVLAPGREAILPLPTFEMLPRYVRLAGAAVCEIAWPAGPYPTDAVLARLSSRTAMIVVVSPNNPTGAVATADDLRRLSAAAPQALLLVDLAYTEFADEDLTPVALGLPNALVTRTFSKAWGLAGWRVGYALGPEEFIGWLRITGNPYAVSGPAAAVAAAWLVRGPATVAAFVACVKQERTQLAELLTELGAAPQPSQGNFVLARHAAALALRDGLARRGIGIRVFPDRPGLEDCFRITCPGDAAAFARLTVALREVFGELSP